jgi:hypothetical protein
MPLVTFTTLATSQQHMAEYATDRHYCFAEAAIFSDGYATLNIHRRCRRICGCLRFFAQHILPLPPYDIYAAMVLPPLLDMPFDGILLCHMNCFSEDTRALLRCYYAIHIIIAIAGNIEHIIILIAYIAYLLHIEPFPLFGLAPLRHTPCLHISLPAPHILTLLPCFHAVGFTPATSPPCRSARLNIDSILNIDATPHYVTAGATMAAGYARYSPFAINSMLLLR